MATKTTIKDILAQYNNNNRDFYIEAIFAEDVRGKDKGIRAVLESDDIRSISNLVVDEIGYGSYTVSAMEYDLIREGGFMLVARLNRKLNSHEPHEIIGFAMVQGDGYMDIAQSQNYFYTKELREAYLAEIAVNSDIRYNASNGTKPSIRGIGTALFDCVRQICEMRGYKYVTLQSVHTPSTIKFYQSQGMLKSNYEVLYLSKVVSPNIETVARVVCDIVEYMDDNNWCSYKQFVKKYKGEHGEDMRPLVGEKAPAEQIKVAQMLLNTDTKCLQGTTIYNVKRAMNEMCKQSIVRPSIFDYVEYMYLNTLDQDGYYNKINRSNSDNRYMQKFGRTSVIRKMPQKEQQKLIYIFNSANLMQADKISTAI